MPALSFETRLDDWLRLRRMTVQTFAAIVKMDGAGDGAGQARLFMALRGEKALPNEVAERLWKLWQEIEALCQRAEPLWLDLSDGLQIYEWLKASREGSVYFIAVNLLPDQQ